MIMNMKHVRDVVTTGIAGAAMAGKGFSLDELADRADYVGVWGWPELQKFVSGELPVIPESDARTLLIALWSLEIENGGVMHSWGAASFRFLWGGFAPTRKLSGMGPLLPSLTEQRKG